MKAAFVYPNSRRHVLEGLVRGDSPDSSLLGANHLRHYGIDASIHESRLVRNPAGWLRWQLREVVVPWELRDADLLVTPLYRYVAFSARASRRPRVVIVNFGLNVHLSRARPTERRVLLGALRSAVRIVCLSDVQRERLLELSGLREERVATVRLGTDAGFFSPAEQLQETPLVVSVGNDLARDWRTFGGAIESLPVEGHAATLPRNLVGVELPANTSTATHTSLALRDLYNRASCVAVVQYSDDYLDGTEHGGTTALIEAMAMGKALVVTERKPLREYVEDGKTALFVPPGDTDALRDAIERVLGDDDLRARLGREARARVEREFTTEHMAARFAPVLEAAAA